MSVSKYRYTESCDGQPCPGDCDLCGKEDDMDDLISRQAAIDAIMSVKRTDNIKSVAMLIMDLPSARPDLSGYSDRLWKAAYERGKVEGRADIVRCKDCEKREYCRTSTVWAVAPSDDWFCADAERRTDE